MAQLPILTELVVSVVGGVLTAIILALFSARGRGSQSEASAAAIEAVDRRPARRSGGFGSFMRMLVAVVGGILIALALGRFLAQMGIIPRGAIGRFILIAVATVGLWLILPFGRRR